MNFGSAADDLIGVQEWNAWVSFGTAICCLLFVVAYAVLARWWQTYEGRVMMGKAIAIGGLALYSFIVIKIAPESTSARWIRIALVGSLGVFMLFQTGRLISNQTKRNVQDKTRRDYHND